MTRNEIIEKYDFNADDLAEDTAPETRTYRITIIETAEYVIDVDAESEEEALKKYDFEDYHSKKVFSSEISIREAE